MPRVLFISDLHINHEAIIRFDNRPFRDKTHMYYSMIARWNEAVNPEDTVYILGDAILNSSPKTMTSILNKLNGTKFLIVGNHDEHLDDPEVRKAFCNHIVPYEEIEIDGQLVVLSHYPLASWKNMYEDRFNPGKASIHLFGHLHMTQEYHCYEAYLAYMRKRNGYPMKAYNISACCPWIGYQPKTLQQIIQYYEHYKGYFNDINQIEE